MDIRKACFDRHKNCALQSCLATTCETRDCDSISPLELEKRHLALLSCELCVVVSERELPFP